MNQLARRGDWLQTYSGRAIWPLDLREEDIVPEDVAHHLALQNRFGGATRVPYSVAQHCVLASWMVAPKHEADAFAHDHHEYAFPDVPAPIKRSPSVGPAYAIVEVPAERAMRRALGLAPAAAPCVVRADLRLLMAEARDLMAAPPQPWRETGVSPWPGRVRAWSWRKARRLFLARYRELFPEAPTPARSALLRRLDALELRFERRRFTTR